MKWFVGLLFIILILLGIMITGGNICLTDANCNHTPEEITNMTKLLAYLTGTWLILLTLEIYLIVTVCIQRWRK